MAWGIRNKNGGLWRHAVDGAIVRYETKEAAVAACTEGDVPEVLRGFAAMNPSKVRELSRAGGKAAHAAGTAHQWSSEEARGAGRLGGRAVHAKKRAAG